MTSRPNRPPIRRAPHALLAAIIAACLIAVSALPVGGAEEGDNEPLPELGDQDAQILTPAQEKRIGQQFLRQLLRDSSYIDDPELNAYLNQLGAKVAKHAALRDTPIALHLIDNSVLNAFAVPGGHITFHTGLLLATEDENELAAVVGHEVAHISQRHLPRMLAKGEVGRFSAAAAILASILIGGQAGLAGLTVANAALISNQLAYTRGFEREADAIGIKLLAEAGFEPSAMGRVFDKIERHNNLGDGVPEFLRTHPLSYTRVAETESRAAAYPHREYPPSRAFHLAQAKIRTLHAAHNQDTLDFFKGQIEIATGESKIAAIYGLALMQRKMRQPQQARITLQPLLAAHPSEIAFQIAQAEIDLAAGQSGRAVARYQRLMKTQPQLYLIDYLAQAMIANNDAAGAKRAVRHQLRRHKERFTLYRLLSKSNAKLGLLAEAHQADAEFHAALGDNKAAAFSLKSALREADSEGYLHQSITARLSEIEEMLEGRLGVQRP